MFQRVQVAEVGNMNSHGFRRIQNVASRVFQMKANRIELDTRLRNVLAGPGSMILIPTSRGLIYGREGDWHRRVPLLQEAEIEREVS